MVYILVYRTFSFVFRYKFTIVKYVPNEANATAWRHRRDDDETTVMLPAIKSREGTVLTIKTHTSNHMTLSRPPDSQCRRMKWNPISSFMWTPVSTSGVTKKQAPISVLCVRWFPNHTLPTVLLNLPKELFLTFYEDRLSLDWGAH